MGGKGRTVGAGPGHRPSTTGLAGHSHRAPPPEALPHGPHRRLMVRDAGPADDAAGPARSAESPRGTPPPANTLLRAPHVPAPGPTRPRPPRSLTDPLPWLLVCGLQGSRARRPSPQTTTHAWVHSRRSWLPRPPQPLRPPPRRGRPASSPSAGPLSADPCVRPLLSACSHPGSAAPRHQGCSGPHAVRQVGLF